jgi:carboxyl-terminal processing protease
LARPFKYLFVISALALVVAASFAGGRHLRRVAATPLNTSPLTTSLPEANIGSAEGLSSLETFQQGGGDPADTFDEVLRYMKSEYVERLNDDKKLGFGAVRTMLMSLDDPKTRFLEPDHRQLVEKQIGGQFSGIGAVLTVIKQKKGQIDARRLAVVAPVPGGPADKAGLRPGDIITEIDSRWVIAYDPRLDLDRLRLDDRQYRAGWREATKKLSEGMSLPKALEVLQEAVDKPLNLTVERPGAAAPLKVTVQTGVCKMTPVEFKEINAQVGYLRVTQFNRQATEAFTSALRSAKQRSIIVDLRDNAGGPVTTEVFDSARALLGLLTKGGQMGTVVRSGNRQEPVQVSGGAGNHKIVALVNGGTANLAEFVAAALRDKAGASLIGSRTFGDGVMQKFIGLSNGAAMTVTAGKFLTAKGVDISLRGVQPDVTVSTGGPHSTNDAAVEQAVRRLTSA